MADVLYRVTEERRNWTMRPTCELWYDVTFHQHINRRNSKNHQEHPQHPLDTLWTKLITLWARNNITNKQKRHRWVHLNDWLRQTIHGESRGSTGRACMLESHYVVGIVNDTIVIWTHGKNELNVLLINLSSRHSKVTMQIKGNHQIPFLHALVFKKGDNTLDHIICSKKAH